MALPTYHLTYNAMYRHDIGARLLLLKHPVTCVAKERIPTSWELDNAASKIPGVRKARIGRSDTLEQTAKLIEDFLDA